MKWRDPKIELPSKGQVVAILTEPHKGNAPTTGRQIFFAECWEEQTGYLVNNDDIGQGCRSWTLRPRPDDDDYRPYEEQIAGWCPAEELLSDLY